MHNRRNEANTLENDFSSCIGLLDLPFKVSEYEILFVGKSLKQAFQEMCQGNSLVTITGTKRPLTLVSITRALSYRDLFFFWTYPAIIKPTINLLCHENSAIFTTAYQYVPLSVLPVPSVV